MYIELNGLKSVPIDISYHSIEFRPDAANQYKITEARRKSLRFCLRKNNCLYEKTNILGFERNLLKHQGLPEESGKFFCRAE